MRREEHALFRRGEYVPLEVSGERREHVIAFLRRDQTTGRSVVVVLPRFACTLMRGKVQLPLGEGLGEGSAPAAGCAGNAVSQCVYG